MLSRLLIILSLISVFLVPLAHADENDWYDVEVIVFAQKDTQQALASESWPDQPPQPDLAHAIHTLDPVPGLLSEFQKLPAGDTDKLDGIWKRLQNSSRYEPLVHVAWVQPGLARNAAPPVDINPSPVVPATDQTGQSATPAQGAAGDGQTVATQPAGDASNPPLVNVPAGDVAQADAGAPAQQAPQEIPPPITGTVTLNLDTYLHVGLHLLYTIPGAEQPQTPAEQAAMRQDVLDSLIQGQITNEQAQSLLNEPQAPAYKQYLLDEVRKVKLDEINYFDNPLFGAIVVVSRHPLPESMQPPAAPDGQQAAGEQPAGGK